VIAGQDAEASEYTPSDSWMPNSIEKYPMGPGIALRCWSNQRGRAR
jgi:hypothetical protein